MTVLPNLSQELEAFRARIAEQDAIIAAMKLAASQPRSLTCKVSEKGAMSVYGLQRMPVTLYAGQWERLIAAMPQLQAFLKTNANLLATKG